MKPSPVHITASAVLEYLERVEGVDVSAARKAIKSSVALADDHPGAAAVISGGFKYILKGGAVVSVKPNCSPSIKTGGHRR